MYSCYCTCSYDGETLIHIQLFTHATYLYIALEKRKKKQLPFLINIYFSKIYASKIYEHSLPLNFLPMQGLIQRPLKPKEALI